MTTRQLEQVEIDYQGYIPRGCVVACHDATYRDWADYTTRLPHRCDLCNLRLGSSDAAKEIVVELSEAPVAFIAQRVRVRVCRNGVACRRRASASSARAAA